MTIFNCKHAGNFIYKKYGNNLTNTKKKICILRLAKTYSKDCSQQIKKNVNSKMINQNSLKYKMDLEEIKVNL